MKPEWRKNDPFAKREADKYEQPVPSREYISELLSTSSYPLTQKKIAESFSLNSEDELEGLRRRLRAMERDGQVIRNRTGAYGLISKMDLIRGRVIGHPDGFGFVVPEDGGDDLFLTAKRMRGIMHGDKIVARISSVDQRGRREGAPVEVLERANNKIVGRFHQEHGISYIQPSNKRISQDILIPPEYRANALDGQIVVVELVEQPTWRSRPIGKVSQVLGDHMAPGMEVDIAIKTYELPNTWSPEVKAEANQFSTQVDTVAEKHREDLRDTFLVTIDGEDSRDFDDAVYCEPHGNGWRLLVAIADVSHYVQSSSALDNEARERGNSVYFPGQVIPMLPEVLSNGLCSLNPDVDRLCMVCEMLITATGSVRKYRFFEGIMRSSARLTYTEMSKIVEQRDADTRSKHVELLPHLDNLYQLYQIFKDKRLHRGAIDFETTESRIIFGEHRKIEKIIPIERNDAHRLIEEFMIAANVSTAKFLLEHEVPALYRVHNGPSEEKLDGLRSFLSEIGLDLGGGSEPSSKHYAKLLNIIKQRPDFELIQTVLLRSLSQAVYCPDNSGHFGLSFDAYTHFTSPIRRYPDLLVHRAIRHIIRGNPVDMFYYSVAEMASLGEQCSMTERRADDATRDATDWLKCEFLADKVGETFDGKITAVTSFGLFVQLNDMFVEGLVHITALDNDYYHFDPAKHRLTGERTNTTYQLSDSIQIKVMRVSLDEKKVDFELADADAKSNTRKNLGKKKASVKSKKKTNSPKKDSKTTKNNTKKKTKPRRSKIKAKK